MFLRCTTRKKNGKEHRYWNLVENRRVAGGQVVQRQVLYLGEINDSQREVWRKSIEVFEDGRSAPSFVPVMYTGLPAKRERSTLVSAAIITASAAAISSGVNWFFAPTDPCVSTLIVCPRAFAAFCKASAAMKVCAMPVGHDVIPRSRLPTETAPAGAADPREVSSAGVGGALTGSGSAGSSASAASTTAVG